MEDKKKPAALTTGDMTNNDYSTIDKRELQNQITNVLAAGNSPDTSENSLMEYFLDHSGDDWRYVHKFKRWYYWNGSRWQEDDKLRIFTEVRKSNVTFSGIHDDPKIKTHQKVAAVVELLKSADNAPLATEDLDHDPMLLGCKAGTVDLRTGHLLEPVRSNYITKSCLATPDNSECPRFMAFLNRIFADDQETIAFMQRVLGYALSGSTEEHKLFFFYGFGKNGKSVLLDVVAKILGDYTRKASTTLFLQTRNQEHQTALAGLNSARFVQASELPDGATWNDSQIKDMTSSDLLTARFMRGNFFDFIPKFKLFIAGNHQPSFKSVDEAIRRRVVLIPFRVTIPEEEVDTQLSEKLKYEWAGILSWMVCGAVEWHKNGLQIPESIAEASNEYMESEDTVSQFINEKTIPSGQVGSTELFTAFTRFQTASGISATWKQKRFTQAILGKGFLKERNSGGVFFDDLSLKNTGFCNSCGGKGCRWCK